MLQNESAARRKRRLFLLIFCILGLAAVVWIVATKGVIPIGRDLIAVELDLNTARAMANPVPDSPQVLAEAKALYGEHCAHCHGDDGDGEGPEAMMYDPSPADFTAARMQNVRDGELFYKITEGRKPMPSFRRVLTDDQRWRLVRYIRTFASKPAEQKQE